MSSTKRELWPADIDTFLKVCEATPTGKTVRVYSSDGFVPNSYKWRCEIEWIERGKDGHITTGWSGAQRSYGDGPHVTVNGRRAA